MFKGLKHMFKALELLYTALGQVFQALGQKISLGENKNPSRRKRKFKVYSLKLRGSGKLKV